MYMRIFVAFIILIALILGIFALLIPRDQLIRLMVLSDFFNVTLPILAFGALVKYLCTYFSHCHKCQEKSKD